MRVNDANYRVVRRWIVFWMILFGLMGTGLALARNSCGAGFCPEIPCMSDRACGRHCDCVRFGSDGMGRCAR
jgi:hypothetical protein